MPRRRGCCPQTRTGAGLLGLAVWCFVPAGLNWYAVWRPSGWWRAGNGTSLPGNATAGGRSAAGRAALPLLACGRQADVVVLLDGSANASHVATAAEAVGEWAQGLPLAEPELGASSARVGVVQCAGQLIEIRNWDAQGRGSHRAPPKFQLQATSLSAEGRNSSIQALGGGKGGYPAWRWMGLPQLHSSAANLSRELRWHAAHPLGGGEPLALGCFHAAARVFADESPAHARRVVIFMPGPEGLPRDRDDDSANSVHALGSKSVRAEVLCVDPFAADGGASPSVLAAPAAAELQGLRRNYTAQEQMVVNIEPGVSPGAVLYSRWTTFSELTADVLLPGDSDDCEQPPEEAPAAIAVPAAATPAEGPVDAATGAPAPLRHGAEAPLAALPSPAGPAAGCGVLLCSDGGLPWAADGCVAMGSKRATAVFSLAAAGLVLELCLIVLAVRIAVLAARAAGGLAELTCRKRAAAGGHLVVGCSGCAAAVLMVQSWEGATRFCGGGEEGGLDWSWLMLGGAGVLHFLTTAAYLRLRRGGVVPQAQEFSVTVPQAPALPPQQPQQQQGAFRSGWSTAPQVPPHRYQFPGAGSPPVFEVPAVQPAGLQPPPAPAPAAAAAAAGGDSADPAASPAAAAGAGAAPETGDQPPARESVCERYGLADADGHIARPSIITIAAQQQQQQQQLSEPELPRMEWRQRDIDLD
eukprot:TRINITY_DN37749_c1_g1_i2.p1 TRINITY_DN37749_c1_g1~~TRINITY_DN37749_c1_g1_i2.p1  ORF type:complete len:730 (+),score=201.28 TRINITY_DN37749_c1_g1_i2:101-2191(+)